MKNLLWSLWGLSVLLSSLGSLSDPGSVFAFLWSFFIFALWFWNQTWTTRTLRPVSFARASRTFLQGFGETSKDALNCRLWADVRIVRGRLGPLRPSRGRFSSNKSSSKQKFINDRRSTLYQRNKKISSTSNNNKNQTNIFFQKGNSMNIFLHELKCFSDITLIETLK